MSNSLKIRRLDSRRDDLRSGLDELRQKLSPRGDAVSEAGKRRTIEVFGEPLSPQTKFGANNPDLLATCHELGIREVYRVGGAQGVAALAYGVEGLPRVDKIVGPGNLFVALAKRHVFGDVGIDSIAGPSEVVVIADESTRPDYTAADLLAQAEHAPGASILIT